MNISNPEDVYRALLETGEDWADKLGAYEMLEAATKPLLAKLIIEVKEIKLKVSMAEATEMARATETFSTHLYATVRAHTQSNRARVRYDATRALADHRRTEAATNRAANSNAP